ncbi:MAG: type II secretion system protein [Candidatus Gastranaerophilales bacterium]|nr:type II secretion system protein [Candidatus Gastranaerophilales bacterium]
MKTKTKTGFTLAEILIALGIIGVIAAFVISPLVQDFEDSMNRTAWKKSFADISQAVKRYSIDQYGDFRDVFTGSGAAGHDDFRNKLLTYLNYTQKCDAGTALGTNGCWTAYGSYYKLSGKAHTSDYANYSRVILNNGNLLAFVLNAINCNSTFTPNNDNCGQIIIDVNGFKGPNKIGKDIFDIFVLRNGNIIPVGTQGDVYYKSPTSNSCNVTLYPDTAGTNCSADYLRQ